MAYILEKSGVQTEVNAALSMLENLLGYHLTVHNITGVLKTPEGRQLLEYTRGQHWHPLCVLSKERATSRCLHDCQDYANAHSKELGTPWLHTCWAGLTELVVPVQRAGTYFFTVFVGVFRAPGVRRPVRSPVPADAFTALPEPSQEEVARMSALVLTFAQGLLSRAEAVNRMEEGDGGRRDRIRRFIYHHAREQISLKDLAVHLNLSKDRASHLVTELFGMPFRKLLLRERLQSARAILLSSPELAVGDIARNAGIRDEYYFNRAFKEQYGLPPGKYRRRHLTTGIS